MTWLDAIYSDGSKYYVSNPYPKLGESITILLRLPKQTEVSAVLFRRVKNGEEHNITMQKVDPQASLFIEIPEACHAVFDYYTVKETMNEPLLSYHFTLACDKHIYFYNQLEVTTYPPKEYYDFKIIADYQPAEWVHRSVFYQIFPDRFHNGDPSLSVKTGEYTFNGYTTTQMAWNQPPKEYDEVHCLDFYGGDLPGIKEKIPYLKSLNVNALYVNPIFYAATSHRFDCLDYFQVDPHLGRNEALSALTAELHDHDMKLMVDVSVNHTGTAHKWFNKEHTFFDESHGAYNHPESKERAYYFFDEQNNYKAWQNVETLPTLNYNSNALREMIYEGEDALVKHWLKAPYNIDAWRFDVANEMARYDGVQLSHEVLKGIRKSIKSVKPNAYIIGEEWTDCTEHLQGDEWDSAMNYFGFTRPVRQFVGDEELYYGRRPELKGIMPYMGAYELSMRVKTHLAAIPHQLQLMQFNLLDSHDVYRLHTHPAIDFNALKAAVIMLYTFPGTPNVYYGDEVALAGRIDSFEGFRYPMVWDVAQHDQTYFSLYQRLGALKQNEACLHQGGFKVLYAHGQVFAYMRFTHDQALLVIVSMADEPVEVSLSKVDLAPYDYFKATQTWTDLWGVTRSVTSNQSHFKITLNKKESLLFKH